MLTRIKNLQTRDCYYPIYHGKRAIDWDLWNNPIEWQEGYWFDDDDDENYGTDDSSGLIGPFNSLDDVCKAQARHWKAMQSL